MIRSGIIKASAGIAVIFSGMICFSFGSICQNPKLKEGFQLNACELLDEYGLMFYLSIYLICFLTLFSMLMVLFLLVRTTVIRLNHSQSDGQESKIPTNRL